VDSKYLLTILIYLHLQYHVLLDHSLDDPSDDLFLFLHLVHLDELVQSALDHM
jgi:hypothetical protein